MVLKRTLTIILLLCVLPASTLSQMMTMGDVTIRSNPEGALVTLTGEVTVSGVTPVRFRHILIGNYDLKVEKEGYKTYSSKVVLDPGRPTEVSVTLSPKTKYKAALRSLVFPGWGQSYSGQKTKGFVFAVMAFGSATAYLMADKNFDEKWDDYQEIHSRYDRAGTQTDLDKLWPELQQAQHDAYDAESFRRVIVGAVASIYILNLFDALLFFPEERATFKIKGLSINPETSPDQIGVTISLNF